MGYSIAYISAHTRSTRQCGSLSGTSSTVNCELTPSFLFPGLTLPLGHTLLTAHSNPTKWARRLPHSESTKQLQKDHGSATAQAVTKSGDESLNPGGFVYQTPTPQTRSADGQSTLPRATYFLPQCPSLPPFL